MNGPLRRVAWVVLGLFAVLFLNLNYLQVVQAESLRENPANRERLLEDEYDVRRGSILAADGATELARSEDTGGRLRFRRVYPEGPLYEEVTGFSSRDLGRSGLERTEAEALSGEADPLQTFSDLVSGRERVGANVVTTIVPAVQQAAHDALGGRSGAVVALDPRDGAILAMEDAPDFDPNALSVLDSDAALATKEALDADPAEPLTNRATGKLYAPGSTFKLVTASAALADGLQPSTTFPDPTRLELPQTSAGIGNFGGGRCNGGTPITLADALRVSCNTTFAQLGLDLGPERLVAQARAFGFGTDLGGRIAGLAPSGLPDPGALDQPATAQSAIGQRDVRVTPLQMAAVAGAIGNQGRLMAPTLVRRVEDEGGQTLRTTEPSVAATPLDATTAATLTDMMVGVVDAGSGRAAALEGVRVAGKTGTAESGVEGEPPTVWFVGFAPADAPQVAVAVVLEDGAGIGDEATGGRLAAPVAAAVMSAALGAAG